MAVFFFISLSLIFKEWHSLAGGFLSTIEVMDQKSPGLPNSRRQCCVQGAHQLFLNYCYVICIPSACNLWQPVLTQLLENMVIHSVAPRALSHATEQFQWWPLPAVSGHIQMGTCSLPGWSKILVASSETLGKQQLASFPLSRDAKQHGLLLFLPPLMWNPCPQFLP